MNMSSFLLCSPPARLQREAPKPPPGFASASLEKPNAQEFGLKIWDAWWHWNRRTCVQLCLRCGFPIWSHVQLSLWLGSWLQGESSKSKVHVELARPVLLILQVMTALAYVGIAFPSKESSKHSRNSYLFWSAQPHFWDEMAHHVSQCWADDVRGLSERSTYSSQIYTL